MRITISLLLPLILSSTLLNAQYTLQKDYFQTDFFDSFDFFDGPDPTNGFVQYNGRDETLIRSSANKAEMYVSTEQSTPDGRPSTRITSKDSYETGLIILDLAHMPGGICGTWPAFWMFGPNWPADGEIDIIENVNDAQTNQMTLHTGSTCSISQSNMLGSITTDNCDVSDGNGNTGCAITAGDTATFGTAFNANGGGVYATLFTPEGILIWFWPVGSIPADIGSDSPDPSTWSTPLANFSAPCDYDTAFAAQNIVFDTTFCGDWAGGTWSDSSACAAKAPTCESYVANNGADFAEAYWSINGLKVYQNAGAPSLPQPSATGTPSSAVVASTTAGLTAVTSFPPTSTLTPSLPVPPTSGTLSSTSPVIPPLTSASTLTFIPTPTTLITSASIATPVPPSPPTTPVDSPWTPPTPPPTTLTTSPVGYPGSPSTWAAPTNGVEGQPWPPGNKRRNRRSLAPNRSTIHPSGERPWS